MCLWQFNMQITAKLRFQGGFWSMTCSFWCILWQGRSALASVRVSRVGWARAACTSPFSRHTASLSGSEQRRRHLYFKQSDVWRCPDLRDSRRHDYRYLIVKDKKQWRTKTHSHRNCRHVSRTNKSQWLMRITEHLYNVYNINILFVFMCVSVFVPFFPFCKQSIT